MYKLSLIGFSYLKGAVQARHDGTCTARAQGPHYLVHIWGQCGIVWGLIAAASKHEPQGQEGWLFL